MHRRLAILLAPIIVLALGPASKAQTDLQKKLKDTNIGDHWIYDDIARGFEQARMTGKPLVVLFR